MQRLRFLLPPHHKKSPRNPNLRDIFFISKSILRTIHRKDVFPLTCALVFSLWLMLSTFGYRDGQIILSQHIWSDFWANIPLIRSFSLGDNIPPEYPLFPGERIRYHFLFFALVGILEKIGLRIDIALNLLSVIGMTGLLMSVYFVAKKLFSSRTAGWLAMVGVICNASFAWLYALAGPNRINSLSELISLDHMITMGPYDNTVLSAFWKLNIFTNQRHLAFSFLFLFFGIWAIMYARRKKILVLGILALVTLSWMHKAVLLLAFIQLGWFFLLRPGTRKRVLGAVLITIALSIPGIFYLNGNGIHTEQTLYLRLGFLYNTTDWHEFVLPSLSPFAQWLTYWWINWGVLPLGALLGWTMLSIQQIRHKSISPWNAMKQLMVADHTIWMLGATSVFVLANIIAFAADPATNHKLLNYSQWIFGVFAAGTVTMLWKWKFRPVAILMAILLFLGGVFDLFPIINDHKAHWNDIARDPAAAWIVENTPPDAVFLNSSHTTNSITITGRKIFWGWDYFTSSIGYPLDVRRASLQPFLAGKLSKNDACVYLHKEGIDYLAIDNHERHTVVDVLVHRMYMEQHFTPAVVFPQFTIYDVSQSCDLPLTLR